MMSRYTFVSTLLTLAASELPLLGEPLFIERSPHETGVDFTHVFDAQHPRAFLYYSGSAVGAICMGDVDNDGLLDLYTVGAAGENRLWKNRGKLKFSNATPDILTGTKTWGTGASLVDIDNDGDLDLYQCNWNDENQLFLNDGKGGFTEIAGAAGLNIKDASIQASFADIDNDGDLDMFLLCNELYSPTGRPEQTPILPGKGIPEIYPEYRKHYKVELGEDNKYGIEEYGRKDYLFLNLGKDANGTPQFKDVSFESGVQLEGFGLSSVWWDYDLDGDLDLYVANDFSDPDRLFRNEGLNDKGVPRFTNVIEHVFPTISWSSMGCDAADINHDGLPDLITAEMAATTHYRSKTSMGALTPRIREVLTTSIPRQHMRNHLHINTGAGMFQETANASGLGSSNWSWAAKFGDLDNDGFQDLFVSNGVIRDFGNADMSEKYGSMLKARIGRTMWEIKKGAPSRPEKNLVFQNLDGKKFNKRPDWGLGLLGLSYSAAMGDLDNDGDLDIVVSDLGKKTIFYENRGKRGRSLRVRLKGSKSNHMGIGAKVVVTDNRGVVRTRWMNPWTGFQSQNDAKLHFGLGSATPVKLEVFWPSGIYQNSPINDTTFLTVTETTTGDPPRNKPVKLRFTTTEAPSFRHKEIPYDDFKDQPLLPQQLSQLGPCLAAGDVDGDGDTDFFVGGAHRQAGVLFLNEKGIFIPSRQPALNGLAKYAEDLDATWFDADGDADLDLLVVTGSSEFTANDTLHKDRLYLNHLKDGKPHLEAAPDGAFPFLLDNGSCVAATDYDGDGDVDLFIGSRSVPGQYPLPPKNRLIRNDSQEGSVKFTVVTPEALEQCGMVTDAIWADFDKDGSPDLCVATDWGSIRIFKNTKGQLADVSKQAGTSAKTGWWRSIHATDVDGDGDLDLIAGNTGINTKYKQPSNKYPAILYYGDMDGSGIARIVEAKIQKDKDRPLPVRGRF